MWVLIVGRILHGIGGGGLIAVAQAAVADIVSPRDRGRYQAYFSTVHVVASVSGPLLGGLLTEHLSWRWVFWINLPLGAAAWLASWKAMALLPTPHLKRSLDIVGGLLLASGFGLLLVTVTKLGQGTTLDEPMQVIGLAASVLLIGSFVLHERTAVDPLVPLSLFRHPALSLSCAILFIGYLLLVSLSVLVPLQRQMIYGESASDAAFDLLPLTLAGLIGALAAGRLMARSGRPKPLQVSGAAIVTLSLLGIAFDTTGNPLSAANLLGAAGVGIGMQFPTSLVVIQSAVPTAHVGIATAMAAFFRALGAALGVAVLTAILLLDLGTLSPSLAGALSGSEVMHELVGAAIENMEPSQMRELQSGAAEAFSRLFIVCSATSACGFLLSLLLPNTVLRGLARGHQEIVQGSQHVED